MTTIRRRAIEPDTKKLRHIEFIGLLSPESLKTLADNWDDLNAVVPIITLSAMEDDAWQDLWLQRLMSLGPLPVLADRDPFRMMRRWRDGGLKVSTARITLEAQHIEPIRRFEVFCWCLEDSGMLFFAPVSGTVAGALAHAVRSMPETFNETTDFLAEHQGLLTKAVSHVLFEEATTGFGFWET